MEGRLTSGDWGAVLVRGVLASNAFGPGHRVTLGWQTSVASWVKLGGGIAFPVPSATCIHPVQHDPMRLRHILCQAHMQRYIYCKVIGGNSNPSDLSKACDGEGVLPPVPHPVELALLGNGRAGDLGGRSPGVTAIL